MKKANNTLGKLDYFSSVDKLADDFMPKIIGASKTNYFDPYPNTWGRQVQKTLHVGPAQSKELNKKQLTELIHELKEKKLRAKKAEEDIREIHTLSKRFMNKPWGSVPAKYKQKYARMDFDGDGVINSKDCYPFDFDRQANYFGTSTPSYFSVPKSTPPPAPKVSTPTQSVAPKTTTNYFNVPSTPFGNFTISTTPKSTGGGPTVPGSSTGLGSWGTTSTPTPTVKTTRPSGGGGGGGSSTPATNYLNVPTTASNSGNWIFSYDMPTQSKMPAAGDKIVGTTTIGGTSYNVMTGSGGGRSTYLGGYAPTQPTGTTVTRAAGEAIGDGTTPDGSIPVVPDTSGTWEYDNVYGPSQIDEVAKWNLYNSILAGKINDPALKAALEKDLEPYMGAYKSKTAELDTVYKQQQASLQSALDRKDAQMKLIGGVNLVNQAPYKRAQEIVQQRSNMFSAMRDSEAKAALDKLNAAPVQTLEQRAAAAAEAATAARSSEYMVGGSLISSTPRWVSTSGVTTTAGGIGAAAAPNNSDLKAANLSATLGNTAGKSVVNKF